MAELNPLRCLMIKEMICQTATDIPLVHKGEICHLTTVSW